MVVSLQKGWAALHYAAARGRVDVVQYLLSIGALGSSKTKRGQTAGHLAAASGNVEIVTMLAQKGVDLNERDKVRRGPPRRSGL